MRSNSQQRREDLRLWVGQRKAAAQREEEEMRAEGPVPEAAIRAALALVAFAGEKVGWPPPEDAVSIREDKIGYAHWVALRKALTR